MRAFILRLNRHDRFDGETVHDDVDEGVHESLWHDLRPEERGPQDKVQAQWDTRERKLEVNIDHDYDIEVDRSDKSKDLLKWITYARLAAVHVACQHAGYEENEDVAREVNELEADTLVEDLQRTGSSYSVLETNETHQQRRGYFREMLKDRRWSSSRIDATLKIIAEHLATRQGKVVVFSEFLCTLDVLDVALLEELGITALRFDGTRKSEEKTATVSQFESDKTSTVLLVTNKSGGVGLSFTDAGLVIHLTPGWNPASVAQCTDRVIRYPQKKTVYVYHMFAHDSIEERVSAIQYEKRGKTSNIFEPDKVMMDHCTKVVQWKKHQFTELVCYMRYLIADNFFTNMVQMRSARSLAIEHAETEAQRLRDAFSQPR
jgi:SNF2 family DNA or RNA helicase